MTTLLLNYDPFIVRMALAALAVVLAVATLLYSYIRRSKNRASPKAEGTAAPASKPRLFGSASVPAGYSPLADIMRAALILLAIVVAVGFLLILLPEGTVTRMTQGIRSGTGEPADQEQISLLYLGDEIRGNEFHVRGVIRNISTQPIEKLDAAIRLYGPDGSLAETTVIRMDTETIAPDATSTFNLAYPDFNGRFGSYSVDFKLRQNGEIIPYKDMRGPQGRS